jgi:hypothetical protein
MIALQFRLLDEWIIKYGLWFVLCVSLLINLLRLLLVVESGSRLNEIYEIGVNLQIYALLPMLPIVYPSFMVIIRRF